MVNTTGNIKGSAGKIGLAIHGKLNDDQYTEEALDDYNEALVYLKVKIQICMMILIMMTP